MSVLETLNVREAEHKYIYRGFLKNYVLTFFFNLPFFSSLSPNAVISLICGIKTKKQNKTKKAQTKLMDTERLAVARHGVDGRQNGQRWSEGANFHL